MSVLVASVLALLAAQVDEDTFGGGTGDYDRAVEARDAGDREKSAMRRRLAEDRVRTDFLKREEQSIFAGIQAFDRELTAQRRKGAELVKKRARLGAELERVDAELAQSNQRLAELRDEIGRRAAAMMRMRKVQLSSFIEARSRGPLELRRLKDRLRMVLDYDADLVRKTRDASAEARRLAAELAAQRTALDEAEAELGAQAERTLELRAEREALLGAIKKERHMIERIAAEIAAAAKKLDGELGQVRGARPAPAPAPGGFSAQKGRLPWPVSGRLEVPFGKRVDADTGMVMDHKGIDVRAALAAPVRAVFEGRVVHRGWLEGFGRVLVLEHPEGWYSVHAHLESFAVQAEQQVGSGQVIGFVGDSGSLKGAYLYFELRQGRRAVDPASWLARE